jgi:glycine/D-amino acid oxidase-like deaminating enzyme
MGRQHTGDGRAAARAGRARNGKCGQRIEVAMKSGAGNWGKTPWKIAFRAKAKRLPERADIVIVGGGFTGLAAAAMAKRLAPRKSVLLLEAERIGNGASGRTGGMALAETAAGKLPGLGDVLKGYRAILRKLGVKADVKLPGVWELARGPRSMEGKPVYAMKNSPIEWSDSGQLRVVKKVAGGSVDPGKVVSGLARAGQKAGAQIVEQARVERIEFGEHVRLYVARRRRGGLEKRVIEAGRVLIATNAGSLELGDELFGGRAAAEPKLTFAIATAPLTKRQIAAIGLGSGRAFYTVDLPYLWGRLMKNGGIIWGSGLVPGWGEPARSGKVTRDGVRTLWSGLEKFDVREGEATERLCTLEERVRGLHPALRKMRVTHRWGGPILITKDFLPVFRKHPKSTNVIVSGGYSGHGVALSVYLGARAARVVLDLERGNWELKTRKQLLRD